MGIYKEYQKVDGHPGLFRDPQTRAVINMNAADIDKARARKEKQKEQVQKMEAVQKDVDQMKSDIGDIKHLLQKLAGQ
jgi:predicted metal-dependent phosphoesterase TrpH